MASFADLLRGAQPQQESQFDPDLFNELLNRAGISQGQMPEAMARANVQPEQMQPQRESYARYDDGAGFQDAESLPAIGRFSSEKAYGGLDEAMASDQRVNQAVGRETLQNKLRAAVANRDMGQVATLLQYGKLDQDGQLARETNELRSGMLDSELAQRDRGIEAENSRFGRQLDFQSSSLDRNLENAERMLGRQLTSQERMNLLNQEMNRSNQQDQLGFNREELALRKQQLLENIAAGDRELAQRSLIELQKLSQQDSQFGRELRFRDRTADNDLRLRRRGLDLEREKLGQQDSQFDSELDFKGRVHGDDMQFRDKELGINADVAQQKLMALLQQPGLDLQAKERLLQLKNALENQRTQYIEGQRNQRNERNNASAMDRALANATGNVARDLAYTSNTPDLNQSVFLQALQRLGFGTDNFESKQMKNR